MNFLRRLSCPLISQIELISIPVLWITVFKYLCSPFVDRRFSSSSAETCWTAATSFWWFDVAVVEGMINESDNYPQLSHKVFLSSRGTQTQGAKKQHEWIEGISIPDDEDTKCNGRGSTSHIHNNEHFAAFSCVQVSSDRWQRRLYSRQVLVTRMRNHRGVLVTGSL